MGYYYNDDVHRECRDGLTMNGVNAKANAGLTTGIIGTALALLNGGDRNGALSCLIGHGCARNNAEAEALLMQIQAQAEISQLKAEKYADKTAQDLFNKQYAENKELSGYLCAERNRITALEGQIQTDKALNEVERLRAQLDQERAFNVYKFETEKRIGALEASVPLVQERCMGAICAEREKRECADNAMVAYMNATFYPKQVADVTVGTTTVAQTVYNPLPCQRACGGCCGK